MTPKAHALKYGVANLQRRKQEIILLGDRPLWKKNSYFPQGKETWKRNCKKGHCKKGHLFLTPFSAKKKKKKQGKETVKRELLWFSLMRHNFHKKK